MKPNLRLILRGMLILFWIGLMIVISCLFVYFCFYPSRATAKNLGVQGSIYSIGETDFLSDIYKRLITLDKSGELNRQNRAIVKSSMQYLLRPPPVKGVTDLPPGQRPESHYFDPSLVFNKTITDTDGHLIVKKGQTINPLDKFYFKKTLIFINGDNNDQINWANTMIQHYQKNKKMFKIILVNGNVNLSAKALHHTVYFDQQGYLCKRFKIKHTPTLVYQPKKRRELLVEEISVG